MADLSPIAVARFWSKVSVRSANACWIWHGNKNGRYGRFQGEAAHRIAYLLCCGEIPDDLMVRHLCGNRLCMNPRHLKIGTHRDNAHDAIRLGELATGDRHPKSKLSPESVDLILQNPRRLTGRALAAELGVSASLVSYIRSGMRRWRHSASEMPAKLERSAKSTMKAG